MKVTEDPIIVEHSFGQSSERIWKAITELEDMKQWFFDTIPEFNPKVGFKTQFNVRSTERDFLHVWEITEVIPLKKIVYSWTYDSYQGDSFVSFELFEAKDQTTLRVTTTVIEDFPDHISEFKRESCLAGWNYFIKESLAKYLNY